MREPMLLDQRLVEVTFSMGIALFPADAADTDTLIRHAELAMYEAKKQGKNRLACFRPDMLQSIIERLRLEEELKVAAESGSLCCTISRRLNWPAVV